MVERRRPSEPFLRVWLRRSLSIPGLFLFTAILVFGAPAFLLVLGFIDIVTRNDFRCVRFFGILLTIASLHTIGLVLLFDAYLRGGAPWVSDKTREIRLAARAEAWWASAMLGSACRIYRIRVDIEGQELAARGRLLVLMRHTSILDTMIPLALFARPYGKHVRYVMKDLLRWNPAADVVGKQIPTAFVGRSKQSHEADLAEVASLGDNLGSDGMIVIYPEGTRFTKEKQQARLAHIAAHHPRHLEKAKALRHTLPLYLGGALALLSRAEGADVAFLAHVGLDQVVTLRHFMNGALRNRHLRVKLFSVPASEVPTTEEARIDWLYDQWKRVDDWVGAELEKGLTYS